MKAHFRCSMKSIIPLVQFLGDFVFSFDLFGGHTGWAQGFVTFLAVLRIMEPGWGLNRGSKVRPHTRQVP